MNSHAMRTIGGCVDEEGGVLTEAVRGGLSGDPVRRSRKAHPDVFNVLLRY